MEIGGFPDWFGSIAEDMYVCCVARLWGHPVRVLPESGFRHWVGHSFGGGKVTPGGGLVTSVIRRALSERNKTFVLMLAYPAPWFQVVGVIHLFLLLAEGLALSLMKGDTGLFTRIYLNCLKALWREKARLGHFRKAIQAGRVLSSRQFFHVFSAVPHKLRMLLRHGFPTLTVERNS
jgi:hypothetical protein